MFTRDEVLSVGRAVITGGRQVRLTAQDGEWLVGVLRQAHISEVAVGGATGVDTDAETVLRAAQFKVSRFPARWETQGTSAGCLRNWAMGKWAVGRGSFLVAFPGGRGTAHMVSVAKRLQLRVVFRHPTQGPTGQPLKSPVASGNCGRLDATKPVRVRETRPLQSGGSGVVQVALPFSPRTGVQPVNGRVIALRQERDRVERDIFALRKEMHRLALAIDAEYTHS